MERKDGPSFALSEDKETATFEYSFNRWDFDRAWHVPIWNLTYQTAWLFLMAADALDSKLSDSLRSDLRVVNRCQEWELSPSFYRLVKPGTRLKVSSRLLHLGRSSVTRGGEIVHSSTNQILVKGIMQDVNISLDTLRSEPFPDWIKDRCSDLTSQPRPKTVEVFEKSALAKTFSYNFTVLPTDIDYNNHTNQRHYIRYCFNCAVMGAKQGAYPTVRGDLFKQGVRKVSVLYQKESLEGDVLTVESWEESPGTLRFQVRKGREKVVQVTMQFFVTSGFEPDKSKL